MRFTVLVREVLNSSHSNTIQFYLVYLVKENNQVLTIALYEKAIAIAATSYSYHGK